MRRRVLHTSDPGPHDARLSLRIGPSNDRPQRVGVRSYSHLLRGDHQRSR